MTDAHSTAPASPGKPPRPSEPFPEFPLSPHPARYWCKKIRGKLHTSVRASSAEIPPALRRRPTPP